MAKTNFDRSKFKGATVASNKASMEDAQSKTAFQGGRPGYITIKEGKTVLRIAPPHGENDPALEPICKVWLPRKVDDGKGNEVVKNMPIFNARVHSPISRDVADEYISFVSKMMYNEHSKEEAKKRLAPVNGWKGKDGKWNSGIRPNLSFDAYAWEVTAKKVNNVTEETMKFGRVNLNKTMADKMNELSIDESAEDEIAVDPFSDPDTGVGLIIVHSKTGDDKWKGSKGNLRPLTDEQLMELDEAPSLASMLRNAYTQKDFENAIEGLTIFDEKNGYGVMMMEEFITILEEIREEVYSCPEIKESNKEESTEEEEGSTKSKTPVKEIAKPKLPLKKSVNAKPAIKNDVDDPEEGSHTDALKKDAKSQSAALSQEEDDGLDELELADLIEYNNENELGVVIKSGFPKSKVLRDIRAAIKLKLAEGAEEEVEEEEPPFEATAKAKTGEKKETPQERMARLRKKK